MAGSIKLFEFVLELYRMVDICPPQTDETILFNWRNVCFLFCNTQLSILSIAYFLLKATTIIEFASSVFMSISQFYIGVDILILIWRITNILELIKGFEEFIERSKYRAVVAFIIFSDQLYLLISLLIL